MSLSGLAARSHLCPHASTSGAGTKAQALPVPEAERRRCRGVAAQAELSRSRQAGPMSRGRGLHRLVSKAVPRPTQPPPTPKRAPGRSAAPDADELAEAAAADAVAEDVEVFSDAELQDELQELRARAAAAELSMQAAEQAAQSQKDKYLRLNADWENYRKRTATEQSRVRADAKGDVVKQLLPLVDSFELARSQLQPANDGEIKIDAAYQGVYKQMVDLMKAVGVTAVPGEGSLFDPNVHDAIMREPSEEVPDGTVLQVMRRGFLVEGKLLRPAMVKVSFSEAPAAPSSPGNAAATDADAFEDVIAADSANAP